MHHIKRTSYGFTILEVLIVLTIASLILLIVFLAVPAAQRGARNTQRKRDSGILVAAITECVNSNPDFTYCEIPSHISVETSDFGIYTGFEYARTKASNGQPIDCNEDSCPVAFNSHYATLTKMTYLFYTTCNVNGAATSTSIGRQFVVIYKHETGGRTGNIVNDEGFNCAAG